MSRRAAASSSSRFSRPCSTASAVVVSAVLRARAMISSACSRASLRRARYSARIFLASSRVFSASSMDSRIALARLSSASWIRGKATLLSTYIVIPKTSSVQIIRPRLGETRKLPPESLAARGTAVICVTRSTAGLEEERDQTEDERVEGDRLGQREAEPADLLEVVLHLGLAGNGLDLLTEDEPDADSCPDRPESGTHAQRDRLAGVGDSGVRDALGCLGERNQHFNHESALL